MALKPTVLLYNFTDRRRKNKVNTFCAMHGIRVRTVEKELYGKPMLALLAGEDALPEDAGDPVPERSGEEEQGTEQTDFAEELLVMCNVGGKMNPFLSYLRREKVIVPLKAVLTPVNQFWSSIQLYQEIKKEHELMTEQEA